MCMGCGSQDHEGRIQYARTSENSPEQMTGGRVYFSQQPRYSQAA